MNMKGEDKRQGEQSMHESAREQLNTEYEQQLQQYEAEVRNHIKIEQ